MSEHAFDPMPDEESETSITESHAIVTAKQLNDAIVTGRWAHDTQALWLNSAFPAKGRDTLELTADLEAHGIRVQWPNPAGAP